MSSPRKRNTAPPRGETVRMNKPNGDDRPVFDLNAVAAWSYMDPACECAVSA